MREIDKLDNLALNWHSANIFSLPKHFPLTPGQRSILSQLLNKAYKIVADSAFDIQRWPEPWAAGNEVSTPGMIFRSRGVTG